MLTLITVNYRSSAATIGLLRSLERQTDRAFDVIVVDNASSADDRAALSAYVATSPLALDIIHSDTNRGFSGGNNLAIRKALAQGASWLVLINPDTTVGPEFVASVAGSTPDEPSLVGLPLREGDRTAYAGILHWLRATLPHAYRPVGDGDGHYAIGAAMLVHRDVFARVGLLDERYFLYFEDAEFSCRARTAGVPVRFAPSPVIAHAVSATTASLGVPLLLRYHVRNALLLNRTHGPAAVRAWVPFWAASMASRQLVKAVIRPSQRAHARAILAGIADHYLGRYGIIA